MRLDLWLDIACLFRTRSEAQKACKAGHVDVNGESARPHREVKPGDEIEITRRFARRQKVVVKDVAERHIAKAKARELYEDLTPKPSPEELEMLRLARMAAPFVRSASAGAPDKRERRALRRLKGRE